MYIFLTFFNLKLSKEELQRTEPAWWRLKENLLRYEMTPKTSTRQKFQLFCESARSTPEIILSPLDYSHICSVSEEKS